jgi:large subunit ribosomal protein L6
MSRIAKNPIALPKGVDVTISGGQVSVKGPLGTMTHELRAGIELRRDGDKLHCSAPGPARQTSAMSGTTRALVANMVTGVSKGFEKKLSLVGVGYRAQAQGDQLNLSLGFSHPVMLRMPKGIKVATPTQTEVVVSGIDKQLVGQVAAKIREARPPEPYKGKGVRYAGETVSLKETKKK